jgi:hypothetical protein
MSESYQALLKRHILNETTFVKAVMSGQQSGAALPWQKVVLRPVLLKEQRHLQFSYFDAAKDITKNYSGEAAEAHLDELLGMPFRNFYVQATDDDLQVHINKKGKVTIGRHKGSTEIPPLDLRHDRQKQRILGSDSSRDFLQAVGIVSADGKIRADKQDKYVQINEFLKLVEQTGVLETLNADTPVYAVDFGCGNAYLTFALYHYFTTLKGLDFRLTGVDVNETLLRRHADKVAALGWQVLDFTKSRIIDYHPSISPDMVVALHACDTATDEALAQGIQWGSRLIVAAPCCQHNLQTQLCERPAPAPFDPVWQDGILGERMGDILTDTFRALILRVMGYQTDVVQFVASEHTPKNLMIRAIKTGPPAHPKYVAEYRRLKEFWGVTPYLEGLLKHPLKSLLTETTGEGS